MTTVSCCKASCTCTYNMHCKIQMILYSIIKESRHSLSQRRGQASQVILLLTETTLGHQMLVLHTLACSTLVQFANFPPSTVFGGTDCSLSTIPSLCFLFQTSLERVQLSQDRSQRVHLLSQSLSALFRLLMVACHPFIFIHYVLVLPNLSAIVKDSCGKTLVELANPVAPENLRSEGGILI